MTECNEEKGIIVMSQGSYLSVLDSWKNIAPIMDAALVDLDGSGQVRFGASLLIHPLISSYTATNRHLLWGTQQRIFEYREKWS